MYLVVIKYLCKTFREKEVRPLSGRSDKHGSRPNSGRNATVIQTSITPVKVSRKDLRLIPDQEISVRRSNLSSSHHSVSSPPPQGKKPMVVMKYVCWTANYSIPAYAYPMLVYLHVCLQNGLKIIWLHGPHDKVDLLLGYSWHVWLKL